MSGFLTWPVCSRWTMFRVSCGVRPLHRVCCVYFAMCKNEHKQICVVGNLEFLFEWCQNMFCLNSFCLCAQSMKLSNWCRHVYWKIKCSICQKQRMQCRSCVVSVRTCHLWSVHVMHVSEFHLWYFYISSEVGGWELVLCLHRIVLLLLSLSRCWTVFTCGISTAFLHAPMFERLCMRPPVEVYPEGNCIGLLKRAMYGLKQAPVLWQIHFAKTMVSLGFHRCKTDPNLCCHSSKELYVLCYVDDFLVCGKPECTTEQLSKEVLSKVEGELKRQATVNFSGRTLWHNGDSIDITMPTAYVSDMLKLFGMENARPLPTTGTSTKPYYVPQPLNNADHKAYRAIVGKLLWLALIKPDISYATMQGTVERFDCTYHWKCY